MLLQQIPVFAERTARTAEERQHARIHRRPGMSAASPFALDLTMTIAAVKGLILFWGRIDPGVIPIVLRRKPMEAYLKWRWCRLSPADAISRFRCSDSSRLASAAQAELAVRVTACAVARALKAHGAKRHRTGGIGHLPFNELIWPN